jgi:succinate dehydrogenase / fumarate reductase iron-sulfur subunit
MTHMKLTLMVWRQKSASETGKFVKYDMDNVSPDCSFLEMLDELNEKLVRQGEEPVAFEHDCREGICGACSMTINGRPHGPKKLITTCQLHMRSYKDGDTIYVEPFRARAFPVVKDLVVNRSAFDRIQQSGGYISVNTGAAQEANAVQIPKDDADEAFNAAACIGCGACVAACPNGSASLFTSAKIAHLGLLAQGQAERYTRVLRMVETMDEEIFGSCTNLGECQEACPKGISIKYIARMNRDFIRANLLQVGSLKGNVDAQ